MRDVAPISREQWLLPLLTALLVAVLEGVRMSGHRVPGGGAIVFLVVLYTAYRAGIVPAMIGAGLLSIYGVQMAAAGFQLPGVMFVLVAFGAAVLVGWLSSSERAALAKAIVAQDRAEKSETRYRDLVNGLEAVVWEAEADNFRVRFVSKRAEAMFGYSTAEWIGSSQIWRRLIHPDDYEQVIEICRKAVVEGRDHDLEWRAVTRLGEVLYVRDIVQLDRSVIPPVLRGVLFDVSAERHATSALEDTERRLRAFINNAPDALLVHDAAGRIVEVNRRACESLGYRREELLSLPLSAVDLNLAQAGLSSWEMAAGQHSLESMFRTRSGKAIPVEIGIGVWEQDPPLFITVARDITRKAQLEEQLRQAQRMEAVGRLAGGIAHDFNNLLTAIRGHAELLRSDVARESLADLDQIVGAAERAASLTRQLLAYSRQQMLQMQVLDLNSVVVDMQMLVGRIIGENIALVTQLESDLPAIEADRTQLEQVVMNLVLNARDAMPDGGRITIRTARAILTEVDADKFAFIQPGNFVMLSVADTGIGMAPDVASRIFDPFFTTKDQSKNSGLGLATAYGIVKQLDGYIWCDSAPGEGTLFRVYLPPAQPGAKPAVTAAPAVRAQVRRGEETILVVEDEPAVRSLVRRVLQKHGYKVFDAPNGAEALRVAAEIDERIHLLLTDVVMPEMSGHDLAQKLGPVRPDMKILYMSGYAEDGFVVDHVLQPGFAFLPKPFAPEALAAKVRETLES